MAEKDEIVHRTYVTPAGFTCSCQVSVSTLTGADASRRAFNHGELLPHGHSQVLTDFRQFRKP